MHNAHPADEYLHLACLPTIEFQTDHDDEDHVGRSNDNDDGDVGHCDDNEDDIGHSDGDDLMSMIMIIASEKL